MFNENEEIAKEAKEIARKTIEAGDLEKYVEGAAFRIIKMEREISRLKFNFYTFVFILVVLPVLVRV